MIRRWSLILLVAVLVCGTVLSLPAFWGRPVVGEKATQVAQHWLDCVFTASSALTGTGLSPHEIGEDFNFAGQVLVLVLMQVGGLGTLIAGSLVGWHFRRRFGWGTGEEGISGAGPRRVIALACILMLVLEAGGAAGFYFSAYSGSAELPRPVFAAVFHAVSAFCNNGLTLTHNSFVGEGRGGAVYGILLPLMVLGSIGGPVLCELPRRLLGARAGRRSLSRDARVTLWGTAGLIVIGAAAVLFTESTPRWQLRNPREDTPGRLMLGETSGGESDRFTIGEPSSAARQRMRTMGVGQRTAAALFHSVSARSAGFRVARLDEKSLSPAGRTAMMALMLVGGGLGGTGGGLYIVVVAALLGTLWRCREKRGVGESGQGSGVPTPPGPPLGKGGEGLSDARPPVGEAVAGVLVGMVLLAGFVAVILVYREPASMEMSLFTAVSACTNTGLAVGTMRLLSVEGQVVVVLAMILGRVIPLAVLANALRVSAGEAGVSLDVCSPEREA